MKTVKDFYRKHQTFIAFLVFFLGVGVSEQSLKWVNTIFEDKSRAICAQSGFTFQEIQYDNTNYLRNVLGYFPRQHKYRNKNNASFGVPLGIICQNKIDLNLVNIDYNFFHKQEKFNKILGYSYHIFFNYIFLLPGFIVLLTRKKDYKN